MCQNLGLFCFVVHKHSRKRHPVKVPGLLCSRSVSCQERKITSGADPKCDRITATSYNCTSSTMQVEDPRIRYKQLQNERCSTESIPLQPLHGSPYHVYPASNFPAVKAFQGPNPSLQSVSASPLLSTKSQYQLEMSPILKQQSPIPARLGNIPRRQTIQETSFSNNIDTDAVVAKINNMFPTASDDHIRLLLKKYLKTVFPTADETMLLDILANSDNNVQKASETLITMGYQKRDMAPPKVSSRVQEPKREEVEVQPKILTLEEKKEMKTRLQQRYKTIAERIIIMALESVNYSEDRALQILQIVQQEDETKAKRDITAVEISKVDNSIPEEAQTASERNSPKGCTDEDVSLDKKPEFKSIVGRITTVGHNSELSKGSNDTLLLADYVTWNGANPDISLGHKNIATGHDSNLLGEKNFSPRGHNAELCKGPNTNLAKGSIYSQLNQNLAANVKCN